ncbi:hypothetical protein ACE6H2_026999 [Prunus campanulata]
MDSLSSDPSYFGRATRLPIMLTEEREKLGFLKNTVEFCMSRRNEAKSTRSNATQRSERIKREYPPTIPLLAQTGNLRGRMPWILTKHYDHSNGRLVLKGERVKHHEYFEVHREDGRLILNLVPLDNALACFDSALTCCDEENEEELEMDEDLQSVNEENGDDECDQNKVNDMVEFGSTSFCDVAQNIHEHLQSCLGHPASAPLRPMTPLM